MAIPERLESITTNLPSPQLEKVVEALRSGNVQVVPGSHSLFAESGGWKFDFEGATYSAGEILEMVSSVALVSGGPEFVQTLIDKLEADLSAVVGLRDFDKAKILNGKIEDLTKLLSVT